MHSIEKVDKNFKVETNIGKEDVTFYDVLNAPFKVYGVTFENGKFRRMPEEVAKAVSVDVHILHSHTAGGRVRFRTDSPYIAIHAKMPSVGRMPHFALCGSSGFDLYVRENGEEKYIRTFMPPVNLKDGYESVLEVGNGGMREFTINFPLYSEVSALFIGLSDKASVLEPTPYTYETPVVYYGSSITQGGCASRPGNSYQGTISRRLHTDYINLGFSGSARAEDEMIAYVCSLPMSVFVYDYDHNAPSLEHLEATHEKMFKAVRAAHPTLPVVMMSSPQFYVDEYWKKRREVIETTYQNAKAAGDENVYYIPGNQLMAMAGNEGTVDGCHPTDFGFASMAKAVGDLLEKLLK